MFAFLKKKRASVLGIDIGLSAINILEISNTTGQYCVEGYGSMPLPSNCNDIDAIATNIKKIISSEGLSTRQAVLALPDSSVISKTIQISAHIPEEDIEDWVLFDAQKYIPYSLNEIYLDFKVLGFSSQNAEQRDVLVVISRAESVERRVAMVKRSGLDVQIVEIESHAIERAAQQWSLEWPFYQQKDYMALFDIHASSLRCFLLKGGHIIYSREEGLSATDDLASFHHLLLKQIQRHLLFCGSNFQCNSIDRIGLIGANVLISDFKPFIEYNLNTSIYVMNPFFHFTCATSTIREKIDSHSSELIVACGLALRR